MSGWLNKLVTAVRGGVNEVGESLADSQAMRTLDQEIRDAENELNAAKSSLTTVVAEQVAAERKVKELQKNISEHEGYTMQALDKGNDELAGEIADKLATLESELAPQQAVLESHTAVVRQIKATIKETGKTLQALKTEVAIEKTQEQAHKAQQALASRYSGTNSAMVGAKASLERIKVRRQKEQDRMKAALDLEKADKGGDLQAKMQEAGLIGSSPSRNAILERLKNRSKN